MGTDTSWQEHYINRFYRSSRGWTNGTRDFHDLCSRSISPGARVLEIGAGPSNHTSKFLSKHFQLFGADVSDEAQANDALREFRKIGASGQIPYPDGSFDACVSDYVLEHVDDPSRHFQEVLRLLGPNGVYVFRTPNRNHYVSAISAMTSHGFHKRVANWSRALPPDAHEPWPTRYRCNTVGAVLKQAIAHKFYVEVLDSVEKEPSYARFSRLAFLLGVAYERVVNSSESFEPLRSNLFTVLRTTRTEFTLS